MRIAIDTIPEGGLPVEVHQTDEWATEVAAVVLEAPVESLSGSLLVEQRGPSVRVRGTLKASGTRSCERCGEETPLVLDSEFSLSYVAATDMAETPAEVRLTAADLDIGWYDDDHLDLASVVSEALALELPSRIICADTAACDVRAAALLSTAGGTPETSGPFAALDKLF